MNKLKLMTIIGTRPEIIRLSAVIKKCDVYFDQILVHTGQNYDYNLNQVFFEDLGLRAPNFYLDAVGKDLGETIGNIIAKSYALMVEQKPDALLILGDTNSCLSAIAAKRLHIPIFHMEAGNRCFDECLPEETNRRIVDHISDVNMCYSEHARRYLNAEGTAKEVKSLRAGGANLKDSWADIDDGELIVKGMHISPYDHGNIFNKDPRRPRRLLAHKSEIRRLGQQIKLQGYTLVPLSLYFKKGRVKLELGLCKGKKLYDKRATAAARDAKRDIERALKSR